MNIDSTSRQICNCVWHISKWRKMINCISIRMLPARNMASVSEGVWVVLFWYRLIAQVTRFNRISSKIIESRIKMSVNSNFTLRAFSSTNFHFNLKSAHLYSHFIESIETINISSEFKWLQTMIKYLLN